MKKIFIICLSLFTFVFAKTYKAQNKQLPANSRVQNMYFGQSVSIDGNFAIVGANGSNSDTTNSNLLNKSGSVYFYKKNSNLEWEYYQKVVPNDRATNDKFGISVSIKGNFAAIGSLSPSDSNSINSLTNSGAVYIFELKSSGIWTQIKKISAPDRASGDIFGFPVLLKNDFLMIGSQSNSTDENGLNSKNSAGAIYAYNFSNNGNTYFKQKITARDRDNGDSFGSGIDYNGRELIIGATSNWDSLAGVPVPRSGSVYVFSQDSLNIWQETQRISIPDMKMLDYTGGSNFIFDSTLVIGTPQKDFDTIGSSIISQSGAAYIYNKTPTGKWIFSQKIIADNKIASGGFGNSAAINRDTLLIGYPGDKPDALGQFAGSVVVYQKNNLGLWVKKSKLISSDNIACTVGDLFGSSLAITGNDIIIGVPNDGKTTYSCLDDTVNTAGSVFFTSFKFLSQKEVKKEDIKITLYPNPTSNIISIKETNIKINSIQVYNYQGQLVKNVVSGFQTIDITEMPSGLYFLKINTPEQAINKRIIKI